MMMMSMIRGEYGWRWSTDDDDGADANAKAIFFNIIE